MANIALLSFEEYKWESNKRKNTKDDSSGKDLYSDGSSFQFQDQLIFIVISFGKSRQVITECVYIFLTVSKCDRTNDFGAVSVAVNLNHVLIADSLSFLKLCLYTSETI